MKILSVSALGIPDIKVIRFARFCDLRGFFTEPFRKSDFQKHPEMGFLSQASFVQTNESYSHQGVIRGLHFQWNPFMGKLVRTVVGHMVDVVLDIRRGSPYYGRAIAYSMPSQPTADYSEWIWVPPGFAHGNYFLAPTHIEYFCSGEYSPGCEAGICPLADDLDWSLCDPALRRQFAELTAAGGVLSDKDRAGLKLRDWESDPRSANFIYGQC
jgi:dTDP-4-dehydrorhamnose 3,5-epimerase